MLPKIDHMFSGFLEPRLIEKMADSKGGISLSIVSPFDYFMTLSIGM
jgi:hypothetical protein